MTTPLWQYIAAAAIVILAAWGLWKSLRAKSGSENCTGCPLKDDCSRKNQKNRKNTCTGRK